MDRKTLNTVTIITAIVLLPLVVVSVVAYLRGELTFVDYSAAWREPLALLMGFWFRGVVSQKES